MATMYVRRFNYKDSLGESEVLQELKFLLNEVLPAVEKVPGVRSCRVFSGAGALRSDLAALIEMDDAAAYERLLLDATVGKMLSRVYGSWDMKSSIQSFRREITPELMAALGSTT